MEIDALASPFPVPLSEEAKRKGSVYKFAREKGSAQASPQFELEEVIALDSCYIQLSTKIDWF